MLYWGLLTWLKLAPHTSGIQAFFYKCKIAHRAMHDEYPITLMQLRAWASEPADMDQVLTTFDFVEYRLMLCSRTMTHAKSLTCLWLQEGY